METLIKDKKIPKDWKLVTLGKVATYINGKAFKPNEWSNTGLPIIRIQNLNRVKSNFNYCNFTVDEKFKVRNGDLLFAWSGTPETSFGAHIWAGENAVLNQHIFKILVDEKIIGKKYYLFALNHKVKEFVSKAHGTAGLAHITKKKFEESAIFLPPLKTQQLIVSKIEELFSELDKGIENLITAQQQLKTYRQAVLKWAFEGKLTNKKVNDGELPKGWKNVSLKELKQFSIYGPRFSSKDYSENGVAVLRTTDISEHGKVDWENSPKLDLSTSDYEKYKLIKNDLLITRTGSIGRLSIFNDDKKAIPGAFLIHYRLKEGVNIWYIFNFLKSQTAQKHFKEYSFGVGRPNLNVPNIELLQIPLPTIEEQNQIIQEIESRLSVADKMEESINQSLQQAEALRQSILKKAFEGKLIAPQKEVTVYKPKNEYFYQMQVLGLIAKASKQKQIQHGEMTLAKYAYLTDKIYNIPTYFEFNRWHLGPFPPAMKKVINNKQYFNKTANHIEVLNEKTLFKSINPYQLQIQEAVNDLASIFSKYSAKDRPHKTELLATLCKVVEDIQTMDLQAVRLSMKEWKIRLSTTHFKNKAEKFSEAETEKCLQFITEKGWDKELIK